METRLMRKLACVGTSTGEYAVYRNNPVISLRTGDLHHVVTVTDWDGTAVNAYIEFTPEQVTRLPTLERESLNTAEDIRACHFMDNPLGFKDDKFYLGINLGIYYYRGLRSEDFKFN